MIFWDERNAWWTGGPICPDLARLSYFGAADNWRGRVVRGFFWLLDRVWPA